MDSLLTICKWLEQTPVGAAVRQSLWLFPIIETVHLLGMAALVSIVAVFDFRLLGWALTDMRVSHLARYLFPWAWAAFALQVLTGTMLLASEATHMYANPAFRTKVLLIAFAGLHVLVFRLAVYRNVAAWDTNRVPPVAARILGAVSILIWIGVVAAGRMIGFV